MIWKYFGIEFFVFAEVFLLEALAVDFIDFVEFEAGFGFEGREGADSLGGEGAAIDKEEDARRDARLHEAVDFVDDGEGFAGAGGHGDQHLAFAGGDGFFDGIVRLALIGPQTGTGIGRGLQLGERGFEITLEKFVEGGGRVEGGDFARGVSGWRMS